MGSFLCFESRPWKRTACAPGVAENASFPRVRLCPRSRCVNANRTETDSFTVKRKVVPTRALALATTGSLLPSRHRRCDWPTLVSVGGEVVVGGGEPVVGGGVPLPVTLTAALICEAEPA